MDRCVYTLERRRHSGPVQYVSGVKFHAALRRARLEGGGISHERPRLVPRPYGHGGDRQSQVTRGTGHQDAHIGNISSLDGYRRGLRCRLGRLLLSECLPGRRSRPAVPGWREVSGMDSAEVVVAFLAYTGKPDEPDDKGEESVD